MKAKIIEMDVDKVGFSIHSLAEQAASNATEPTKVKMIFHGNNNFKYCYSNKIITDGEPDEALEMFEHLLKTHDRYYDYSDDHRVWRKGVDEWSRINWMMKILTERKIDFQRIYSDWKDAQL